MNSETFNAFRKLPVALQAVIGLAFFALGIVIMLYATFWADGDIRLLMLFFFVGVLYLANGMPSMLEGFMKMIYKKED